MAIFVDENTRVAVQGITGRDGSFHTREMMEYGTRIVAGVTPGKGGQTFDGPSGESVPIFNTMEEAVREGGAMTAAETRYVVNHRPADRRIVFPADGENHARANLHLPAMETGE